MFSRKMLHNVDPPCGAWGGGGGWETKGEVGWGGGGGHVFVGWGGEGVDTPIYNLMLRLCFLYLGRFFGLIFKRKLKANK